MVVYLLFLGQGSDAVQKNWIRHKVSKHVLWGQILNHRVHFVALPVTLPGRRSWLLGEQRRLDECWPRLTGKPGRNSINIRQVFCFQGNDIIPHRSLLSMTIGDSGFDEVTTRRVWFYLSEKMLETSNEQVSHSNVLSHFIRWVLDISSTLDEPDRGRNHYISTNHYHQFVLEVKYDLWQKIAEPMTISGPVPIPKRR